MASPDCRCTSGTLYVVACLCSFMFNRHLWRDIIRNPAFSYKLLRLFVRFSVNECEQKG